jgi:hypothetical protein
MVNGKNEKRLGEEWTGLYSRCQHICERVEIGYWGGEIADSKTIR